MWVKGYQTRKKKWKRPDGKATEGMNELERKREVQWGERKSGFLLTLANRCSQKPQWTEICVHLLTD